MYSLLKKRNNKIEVGIKKKLLNMSYFNKTLTTINFKLIFKIITYYYKSLLYYFNK